MSAQGREWQPGDKALLEVEVLRSYSKGMDHEVILSDAEDVPIRAIVSKFHLRPVPGGGEVEAATEDMTTLPEAAMSAAMSAFARYNSGRIPDYVVSHAIGAVIWAALDAMGGVPGRSEAEIRTEWGWRHDATGLTVPSVNESEARHEVGRFPRERTLVCRESTPWRVAGTTEAGDE